MNVRSQRMKFIRWTICLVLLFSALSCLAPQIYASTDCDRWIAEYKQGLLQKRAVQRLASAKHRLQHRLVGFRVHPAVHPHLRRAAYPRPMGPLTRLRRFMIACGVLPPDKAVPVDIATVSVPGDLPPVPLTPLDETSLVFSPTPPPVSALALQPATLGFPTASAAALPPSGSGGFPSAGGPFAPGRPPAVPSTPSGPPIGSSGSEGPPGIAGIPPVGTSGSPVGTSGGLGAPPVGSTGAPEGPPVNLPAPAPSPVPEPGSFVLVLTGAAAAAAAYRQRTRGQVSPR